MLLDNLSYPDVAGIKKFNAAARLQKEAYRAWAVGLACNVVAGVYALYNLHVAAKKQEGSGDAEKAVEMKKLAKYVACEHSFKWNFFANSVLLGTKALHSSSSSPTCAI